MEKIISWQPAALENELVQLKPLQKEDFEGLYSVASDPLIWAQHPSSNRYQREVFLEYFKEAMAAGTSFLIADRSSQNIIGCTRYYEYEPEERSIAIGYTFLDRAFWGGRYNRAVKMLMLDYAFRFVEKVYFHIGASNIRSQTATSRIGAKKLRALDFDRTGRPIPYFEYVIEKEDWLRQSKQNE